VSVKKLRSPHRYGAGIEKKNSRNGREREVPTVKRTLTGASKPYSCAQGPGTGNEVGFTDLKKGGEENFEPMKVAIRVGAHRGETDIEPCEYSRRVAEARQKT